MERVLTRSSMGPDVLILAPAGMSWRKLQVTDLQVIVLKLTLVLIRLFHPVTFVELLGGE